MKTANFSVKKVMINKTNSRMVVLSAVAAVIVAFSLVGSRALLSLRSYQARVITEKEKAVKQLRQNVTAAASLKNSYDAFVGQPQNVIGGSSTGTGERDGDNARIVLDALPSAYDFPALVSSLEKLLSDPSYKIGSISGTDDEVNQSKALSSGSPKYVEMPFDLSVTGSYGSIQTLVTTMERSIRPFPIKSIELSGNDAAIQAKVSAKTYYQPEKTLELRKVNVK